MVDRVVHRHGCGRVMWEYSPDLDRFGTPMALMDLPMWTDSCATTEEGLLFESSATTPYHFIDQAELSQEPSEAMRGLPYPSVFPDVAAGVRHLHLLGVPYFLASSPTVEAQAAADPALELLAQSGPWHTPFEGRTVTTTWRLYAVRGGEPVVALGRRPLVLRGAGASQAQWLPVALSWFDDPSAWATEMTAGGPVNWPRVGAASATASAVAESSDAASQAQDGARTGGGEPPDAVRHVRMGVDQVSFRVSRPGVPVLVKVSFFPNWLPQLACHRRRGALARRTEPDGGRAHRSRRPPRRRDHPGRHRWRRAQRGRRPRCRRGGLG